MLINTTFNSHSYQAVKTYVDNNHVWTIHQNRPGSELGPILGKVEFNADEYCYCIDNTGEVSDAVHENHFDTNVEGIRWAIGVLTS